MSNPYAPPGRGSRPDGPSARPPDRAPTPDRPATPDRPPTPRPGVPPVGPPDARRPDPDAVARASRLTRHLAVLMLAGLVTLGLPLPWNLAALVFTAAALVVGVRALVTALRAGLRGGPVVAIGLGVAVSTLVLLSFVSMLALWPVQMARQECLDRALTISANRACEQQFEQSVTDRLENLLRPPGP